MTRRREVRGDRAQPTRSFPWLFVLVTTALSIALAALFVRDSRVVES